MVCIGSPLDSAVREQLRYVKTYGDYGITLVYDFFFNDWKVTAPFTLYLDGMRSISAPVFFFFFFFQIVPEIF